MITPKRVVETTPHVVAQIKQREHAHARLRAAGAGEPAPAAAPPLTPGRPGQPR